MDPVVQTDILGVAGMYMAINERIECLHILYGKLHTNDAISLPVKVMWPKLF